MHEIECRKGQTRESRSFSTSAMAASWMALDQISGDLDVLMS